MAFSDIESMLDNLKNPFAGEKACGRAADIAAKFKVQKGEKKPRRSAIL